MKFYLPLLVQAFKQTLYRNMKKEFKGGVIWFKGIPVSSIGTSISKVNAGLSLLKTQ